jgi:hypothetical protein
MKVEKTLLTATLCMSRCASQMIVVYTHIALCWEPKWHKHFCSYVTGGLVFPYCVTANYSGKWLQLQTAGSLKSYISLYVHAVWIGGPKLAAHYFCFAYKRLRCASILYTFV